MYDKSSLFLDSHWMPFTGNRDFKSSPRIVVKAEGMYYWDIDGNKILDGCSGLFTCAAGHCRKEIVTAVHEQMVKLDYTPHFNMGHPSSFELSKEISQITPTNMDKIFFCNSGSEAIDSSIKIVSAYWRAKGEANRQFFISRQKSYHGVNIGGTSLAGMANNRRSFGINLPGVFHIRHTWTEENKFSRGQGDKNGIELANDLERMAQTYGGENIAACYIEPIAGSVGTLIPPKGYLERIREICDKYNILLIFDEVITGFGRTGKAFAADSFGIKPDIMTVAKSITNGAVPMGAVIVDNNIYETVVNSHGQNAIELFHGYTYSAHPIACVAGIATQKIYQDENLFKKGEEMVPYFEEKLFSLREFKCVKDIRNYGLMGGVEVSSDEAGPGVRGRDIYQTLFHDGLHLKTTADTIIIAPALIAKKHHIDELISKLSNQLKKYA